MRAYVYLEILFLKIRDIEVSISVARNNVILTPVWYNAGKNNFWRLTTDE